MSSSKKGGTTRDVGHGEDRDGRGRREAPGSATVGLGITDASPEPRKPRFEREGRQLSKSVPARTEESTSTSSERHVSEGGSPKWHNPPDTHALYDPERREPPYEDYFDFSNLSYEEMQQRDAEITIWMRRIDAQLTVLELAGYGPGGRNRVDRLEDVPDDSDDSGMSNIPEEGDMPEESDMAEEAFTFKRGDTLVERGAPETGQLPEMGETPQEDEATEMSSIPRADDGPELSVVLEETKISEIGDLPEDSDDSNDNDTPQRNTGPSKRSLKKKNKSPQKTKKTQKNAPAKKASSKSQPRSQKPSGSQKGGASGQSGKREVQDRGLEGGQSGAQTKPASTSPGHSQEGGTSGMSTKVKAPDIGASDKTAGAEAGTLALVPYEAQEGSSPGHKGKGKATDTPPLSEPLGAYIDPVTQKPGYLEAELGSHSFYENVEDSAQSMFLARKAWVDAANLTERDMFNMQRGFRAMMQIRLGKRDTVLQNAAESGKPPVLNWSIGVPGMMTLWTDDTPLREQASYDPGLGTRAQRNQALRNALNMEQVPTLRDVVMQDRAHYEKKLEIQDQRSIDRIQQLKDHPEVARFRKLRSGGLIINDNNFLIEESADVPADIAGFMTVYARTLQAESPMNLAITHSAGRNWKGNPNVNGCEGILRSMCAQLLGHPIFPKPKKGAATPELYFLKTAMVKATWKAFPRQQIPAIFREILVEIASKIKQYKCGRSRITVIIDDLDLVEGSQQARREDLLRTLRHMSGECDVGDMGKYLSFQYILMHPRLSYMTNTPDVHERYIVLDPPVATPIPGSPPSPP